MMQGHYYDQVLMHHAIMLARRAEAEGEVPVGAVLVLDGVIIGEGWNSSIGHHDPTAHAEIMALRHGGQQMGNYRLLKTTMYVTMEPCIMCTGAIINARISRLVFGAKDKKTATARSLIDILTYHGINHRIELTTDVLEQACTIQLNNFFQRRRAQQKEQRTASKLKNSSY